jgi:hypothetical protein
MGNAQTIVSPASLRHVETVGGAKYEVTSNYIGEITFIELLKQMLKRDLERERQEPEDNRQIRGRRG